MTQIRMTQILTTALPDRHSHTIYSSCFPDAVHGFVSILSHANNVMYLSMGTLTSGRRAIPRRSTFATSVIVIRHRGASESAARPIFSASSSSRSPMSLHGTSADSLVAHRDAIEMRGAPAFGGV
jgi:hypothetical protein